MALLRSKENQRANMRSFGSSVMMFAMVPVEPTGRHTRPKWDRGRSFQENSGPHGYFWDRNGIFGRRRERAGRREKRGFLLVILPREEEDGNLGFAGKTGSVFTRLLHEFRIYINIKSIG